MSLFKSLALAAAIGLSGGAASAAVILDSLSPNGAPFNYSTNQGGLRFFNLVAGPFGQSFSLAGDTADLTVEAYLSTLGASAVNVTATLVSGTGLAGASLGRDIFSATMTRNDAALALFDFSGLGQLAAGAYTIVFSGAGALGGGEVQVTAPGRYLGIDTPGTAAYTAAGPYDFGGNPARDFGIRVSGMPVPAPVPVPASLPLLLAGLGAVVALRRRAA